MTSLRLCVRCFDGRRAVVVERIMIGADTYDLPLCAEHESLFQRDMTAWTRVGQWLDTGRRSTAAIRAQVDRRDQPLGTVLASHVHVPVVKVPEPEPTPVTPKVPAPRFQNDGLPFGHERWTFSEHALERQELRNVTREQALWAALSPDQIRPGTRPGTKIHIRGNVQVVVAPRQRRIVTVIDRNMTTEQEMHHAASC